ncbi:MAG: aspartate aminotransferase family protein [Thermoplasmata archaeon]|nr:aspartate aminotransferase family protein [Thermoplasmata archaeon]
MTLPESGDAARIVRESNYVGWRRQTGWDPILVTRAKGSTFWDSAGRAYLDFASQLVATNLGHGNAALVRAMSAQARQVAYVAPSFATEARARLTESLTRVLPPGLSRFFYSTSGTEANEAAFRMARAATGRSGLIAIEPSYHGGTSGALSASGDLRRKAVGASSEVPGTHFAPACYCYRCPLGLAYPSCGVACADEVERILDQADDVAAMVVEPVIGTNGVIVPVPEYWPKVRAITRRREVLLIADEVMTGWGRTGSWFASTHFGLAPDILTTAKGITGGYIPLGLTATSEDLHRRLSDAILPVGHTYEGHPVALATAVAAISEYERLHLVDRSRREGEYLLRRLRELARSHPSVGDVRGLGLFAAVELVRDQERKTPFNSEADKIEGRPLVVDEVLRTLAAEGVYAFGWVNHIVLAPPLIVTRKEIDRGLEAMDVALKVSDAKLDRAA